MVCLTQNEAMALLKERYHHCLKVIHKLQELYNNGDTSIMDIYRLSQTIGEKERLLGMEQLLNSKPAEKYYVDYKDNKLNFKVKTAVPTIDYRMEYNGNKWVPVFRERSFMKYSNLGESTKPISLQDADEVKRKANLTANILNNECVTRVCSCCNKPFATRYEALSNNIEPICKICAG